MKRHDQALRQGADYRRTLDATPRALPSRFVDEQVLTQRYGVDQLLADADNDTTAGEAVEANSAVIPADEATQPTSPSLAPSDKAAESLCPRSLSWDKVAELKSLLTSVDEPLKQSNLCERKKNSQSEWQNEPNAAKHTRCLRPASS